MTLRVRISIVPFGEEDREREIHQINISSLGGPEHKCLYGVEIDKYKTREYDTKVHHNRLDGAFELVRKALESRRLKN